MSGEIEARKHRRNLKNRREKRSHLQELEKQEYQQEKQSLGCTAPNENAQIADQPLPISYCARCIQISIGFVVIVVLLCVMVALGVHFFCGPTALPEISDTQMWCDKIRWLCSQSLELYPKLKMLCPDRFLEVDEPKVVQKIIQPLCDSKDSLGCPRIMDK